MRCASARRRLTTALRLRIEVDGHDVAAQIAAPDADVAGHHIRRYRHSQQRRADNLAHHANRLGDVASGKPSYRPTTLGLDGRKDVVGLDREISRAGAGRRRDTALRQRPANRPVAPAVARTSRVSSCLIGTERERADPGLGAGTRGPAARPARARPLLHASAPSHTQHTSLTDVASFRAHVFDAHCVLSGSLTSSGPNADHCARRVKRGELLMGSGSQFPARERSP